MAVKPKLLVVEGLNDRHAILHLLRESGVLPKDADAISSPLEIKDVRSKKNVIEDIRTRKEHGRTHIGYVIDADDMDDDPPGCQPTWQSACHQLTQIGVTAPSKPPADGFAGQFDAMGRRIGVWIMPDNAQNAELEEFLFSMLDRDDPLYRFAETSTILAPNHGARFPASKRAKAQLAALLAWQEKPALTYGQAMQAGLFDPNSPLAVRFCDWIRRLFEL
uniref:DUF4276 family protein n=1 Tax=Schlesneria paludicola TaxID=360056 RepID=A0A7C2JZI1_9PLAN